MTRCKTIILSILLIVLPFSLWAAAPVMDESDNFAMAEEQLAYESPVAQPNDESSSSGKAGYEEAPLVREENYQDMQKSRVQVNDSANVLDKLQSLRQEIQDLRGQLEVQAHDLKLLQQQQLAFYKDLDARLGKTSDKSIISAPSVAAKPEVLKPSVETRDLAKLPMVTVSRVNPANEQISYLAAYELIKNKRYHEALQAMQQFVHKYPQSGYSANAEYWLGELYLLKQDYAKSKAHFETVLEKYPNSSKASAAMLKDGYVDAALGDLLSAKRRLEQVTKTYPNTTAARLASTKLRALNTL